jgi:hypothetical protein
VQYLKHARDSSRPVACVHFFGSPALQNSLQDDPDSFAWGDEDIHIS